MLPLTTRHHHVGSQPLPKQKNKMLAGNLCTTIRASNIVTSQVSARLHRTCLCTFFHLSLLARLSYKKTHTHTRRDVGKCKMTPRDTIASPTEAFRAFQHSATSMLGLCGGSSTRSVERWRLSDRWPAHRVQTHTSLPVCWFTDDDTTFFRGHARNS